MTDLALLLAVLAAGGHRGHDSYIRDTLGWRTRTDAGGGASGAEALRPRDWIEEQKLAAEVEEAEVYFGWSGLGKPSTRPAPCASPGGRP